MMVIGYSFSDAHINKAIGDGIDKGLKLFIIDPCGVDVLDKGLIRDEYMEKLAPNIIGASRRPLRSIFNDDVVEHGRVMKFFGQQRLCRMPGPLPALKALRREKPPNCDGGH